MGKSRRGVDVVRTFCGWDFLLGLVRRCKNSRDRALVSALFLTGGRVSEVLQLERAHFKFKGALLIVEGMPVMKRYEKISSFIDERGKVRWVTRMKKEYRTFPIPMKEPLCRYLVEYLKERPHAGKLFHLSRTQVHRIVTHLHDDVFPHWFRAQRASQLAVEYGFDVHELIDFFNWKSLTTAIHYSRMGWKGLSVKMLE